MTTLLKNGKIINVFTDTIENANVLIEDGIIVGIGDYLEADIVEDIAGRYICPSFIDAHTHIESTMLQPAELAKFCILHGTGAIIADPHEIANVCGTDGINYMLQASEGLPMKMLFMLPSCVPATPFDENGATLSADDLDPFYENKRVAGLAEMMNYPGVIAEDQSVLEKIRRARDKKLTINGHAPMLSGKGLDKYICAGIRDDHECSSMTEALERIIKGQKVLIREGTSARNLTAMLDLFNEPYCRRCMLASDDIHPYDIITNGHIDAMIRKAVRHGKNVLTCIRMATIQAAEHFGIYYMGAVAPGYYADLLVLDDLDTVDVCDVYYHGSCVCRNKEVLLFNIPSVDPALVSRVYSTFNIKKLTAQDFCIIPQSDMCRVIRVIPGELLTNEIKLNINFSRSNGVDTARDIIKLAVCERHKGTGHIGLGFIKGLGMKRGAIASSVSHDSHNLIIAGANDDDMALAGNTVAEMHGGLCAVLDGKVLSTCPLPIAGLMSDRDAYSVADDNRRVREAAVSLGCAVGVEPFMNLAFISLSVIPSLKMTTQGLVDVDNQRLVSLFV